MDDFVLDTHTAAVVRANSKPRPSTHAAQQEWKPTVPALEPWRSTYLALDQDGQRRWDAMSRAQRTAAFGVP